MLEARNIKKQFVSGMESFVLFEHLDFSAEEGEFIIITGRSGSGKSTLLYQLSLLDTPSEGSITIDGVGTAGLSRDERADLRLKSFGYVFQDYGLMPEMNALDNVRLPLIMLGESDAQSRETAKIALERVGLGDYLDRKPAKLSGGQQQRVSIARAIAHNPRYLFADEPTANLDSASAIQVLNMFGEIHKSGTTIIMVTHEKESQALASRVLELRQDGLVPAERVGNPL